MLFPRCTDYLNKENGDSVKVFFGLFITRPCRKSHVERVTTRKSFFIERGNLTLKRISPQGEVGRVTSTTL